MSDATGPRGTWTQAIFSGPSMGLSWLSAFAGRFDGSARTKFLAALLTLVWAVLVIGYGAGYLAMAAESQLRGMMMLDGAFLLLALVFPIGLIWLGAGLIIALSHQRDIAMDVAAEARPLLAELEATRRSLAHRRDGVSDAVEQTVRAVIQTRQRADSDLAETLARLTRGQAQLQATLTALLDGIAVDPAAPSTPSAPAAVEAPRPAEPCRPKAAPPRPRPEAETDTEPRLPLPEEPGANPPQPNWRDLVKAFDFPRDDQDFEGFRALQAVLRYPPLAQMLQSAEDVLTLLSQEGVYMEDLTVQIGDPVHWRRFMEGERGPEVAGVGGVQDGQAMELTQSLLKSDPIFRDTALFFQRRFGRVLQDFAREASDKEIVDVANTRSGRAFMLLTRISGSLD